MASSRTHSCRNSLLSRRHPDQSVVLALSNRACQSPRALPPPPVCQFVVAYCNGVGGAMLVGCDGPRSHQTAVARPRASIVTWGAAEFSRLDASRVALPSAPLGDSAIDGPRGSPRSAGDTPCDSELHGVPVPRKVLPDRDCVATPIHLQQRTEVAELTQPRSSQDVHRARHRRADGYRRDLDMFERRPGARTVEWTLPGNRRAAVIVDADLRRVRPLLRRWFGQPRSGPR